MQKVLFLFKEGKYKDYIEMEDKEALKEIDAPLVEVDFGQYVDDVFSSGHDNFFPKLIKYVKKAYRNYVKEKGVGHYGDVVQVTGYFLGAGCFFSIDHIGRVAFHKPALAADILPFFTDRYDNLFFVGIKRKKGKRRRKFALIGGHKDINGIHLETPAEALMHEAKDEAGLIFEPAKHEEETFAKCPDANSLDILVRLGKGNKALTVYSTLNRLGEFQTSDHEYNKRLGIKRVYLTTAYSTVINISHTRQRLTEKKLRSWFKAGDDAEDLVIVDMRKGIRRKFVFGHHKMIFNKAIKNLKV